MKGKEQLGHTDTQPCCLEAVWLEGGYAGPAVTLSAQAGARVINKRIAYLTLIGYGACALN
jgi:hypothetical protein